MENISTFEPVSDDLNVLLSYILKSMKFADSKMAFDDPATSDFIMEVEGQRIHVHKAILCTRSQYFKNKFQYDWTENNSAPDPSVYIVSDKFSYIVYKTFLKYLYTDTIDLSLDKIPELMILANEYCETNLKKECIQIIERAITPLNISIVYYKCIECNNIELEEFCIQYMLCHMTKVLMSEEYHNLDINIKKKIIQMAVKENVIRNWK